MTISLDECSILDDLAADLDGSIVRPDDADWDTARQAWQRAVDQRPAAVVRAHSVRDVQAVLAAARLAGLRVAPQSTGHNAGPLGPLENTIVLKTSAMRGVSIDPSTQVAYVEAGALWLDVTTAAAEHGLAALAGSSPDVGVAGYTLGGGLSWLARSQGLAANSVLALDVVTADGALRRVSAECEPDLFWALRGGGGSFGIVTAMQFRLYPVREVYAGALFFPIERAAQVLEGWRTWLPGIPEAVTSIGRVLRFPPVPDVPAQLRGKSFAVIEASCQLPAAEADTLLAPLRALGPLVDTFRPTPVAELAELHMDPPGPTPAYGDGMLLRELPAEAVTSLARVASDGALASVELRHLGGALAPGRATGGAFDSIDAAFALFAVGITPDAEAHREVRAAVDAVQHAMAPWATGRCYSSFSERRRAGAALFGPHTYQRLQAVKSAYDPSDVIRANHPVPPLERHD